MLCAHDDKSGFYEHGDGVYDIPDDEWAAYRKLLDLANEIEDRFLASYAVAPQEDEFAHLRGVLTDEEIEAIKAVRHGGAAPAEAPPAPVVARRYVAPKCEHRVQTGSGRNGDPIRCGQCGLVLIARPGVTAGLSSPGLTGSPIKPPKVDRNGWPDYSA